MTTRVTDDGKDLLVAPEKPARAKRAAEPAVTWVGWAVCMTADGLYRHVRLALTSAEVERLKVGAVSAPDLKRAFVDRVEREALEDRLVVELAKGRGL